VNGVTGNIRSKGEKRSWSEQNKERVWAAVTSCLTNVPPTLLRDLAAAGVAAAPAGYQGEAHYSVERFPSNSRLGAPPVTSRLRAPGGRTRTTPPPPIASLAPPRILAECSPELASCQGSGLRDS
jgi:hypothetical protein